MAIRRHAELVTVNAPGDGANYAQSALAIEPPAWMNDALCTQTDPESFFPDKGGSTREAKATCKRCPVQVECLDYALQNEERHGIWGGVSERDRRRLVGRKPTIELDVDEEPA